MKGTAMLSAVAILLGLSGCDNGKFAYADAISDVKVLAGYDSDGQPAPTPTPEEPGAPLIVGFEDIRVAIPYAGKSGLSRVYAAPDGVTISTNAGMVTRAVGLGIDMTGAYFSSDSPLLGGPAKAARDGITADRVIEYWKVRKLKRDKFRCTFVASPRDGGGSTVDETCKRYFEPFEFQNRYWLNAEDQIECSRQWIHPDLSPLQFFNTEQQALTLDLTTKGC